MKRPGKIPDDIVYRLKQDFGKDNFPKAIKLIEKVRRDTLNVGWIQLSRAIVLLSDGSIDKMNEIIECKYYGDPRDVIMKMMQLPGNTNDFGRTPFPMKE